MGCGVVPAKKQTIIIKATNMSEILTARGVVKSSTEAEVHIQELRWRTSLFAKFLCDAPAVFLSEKKM